MNACNVADVVVIHKIVSADTYFVIMITSPRRPLRRMHTTEKSAEKHLQRKCSVLERIEFVPCRDSVPIIISISHCTGSHMTHWGVTAWDWVKRQPPLIIIRVVIL